MSDRLNVVKVVLAGSVTSFRYPHFVQGVQPTYEMPPPSTIYGLICAVTGAFEPHEDLSFGVHFTYETKFHDLEHTHTSTPYLQANPFQRELLYNPCLTLYLTPETYLDAFERPYYPLALGRSQDLMSRTDISVITLEQATEAYFEHTLLPQEHAPRFRRTIAATMAQYIDRRRRPVWKQYAILKDRVIYPDPSIGDYDSATYAPVWVDPTAPLYQGLQRGVVMHQFV